MILISYDPTPLLFVAASMGGAPGLVSPSTGVLSQQQLQQQQLIFNVNQCYSQLMFQQQELMQLRRRMDKVPESPQSRPSPRLDYTSLLTTGSPPAHRSLLVQQQAPYWTAGDDEPRVVTAGLGSDGSVVVNDLENNGNGKDKRVVYNLLFFVSVNLHIRQKRHVYLIGEPAVV